MDFLQWPDFGFSEEVSQVTFSACYPTQKVEKDGTFEFNSFNSSYGDLLLAAAQPVEVGTSEAVSLTFRHALHRLNLEFLPGKGYTEEDLDLMSCTFSAKNTCVVDAVKGSVKEVKDEQGSLTVTGQKLRSIWCPKRPMGFLSLLLQVVKPSILLWMLYLSSRVTRRLHWKVVNRAL